VAEFQNSAIAQQLLCRLSDSGTRFAFPSEIAARSWLEKALELSGFAALPARRFVSWDAFKAERFPGPPDMRPCPALVRSLFARQLMADNAASPFLDSVVPPSVADVSERFSRTVAKALPALGSLPQTGGPEVVDWQRIKSRYETFLKSRNLYEASWRSRAGDRGSDTWVLFFPDLTEDWVDYRDAVLGMADVLVVDSAHISADRIEAASFGTLVDEVRAVVLRVRQEAALGMELADMAISVASAESVMPLLVREASVAGVPLDIRDARPLSESAGGRLASDLLAVHASSRSFASVRRLLLDLSRPWKDASTPLALIDFGIRKHVIAPLPEQQKDLWEASMDSSVNDAVRALYRGIATSSRSFTQASSFGELRQAFDAFRNRWLDDSRWSQVQNDEIARCIMELDALAEAAKLAGMESKGAAAELWLEHLENTRYLPVSAGGGVPVYRFPVAAGAAPKLHLCINMTEDAARSESRPLAFLREAERERAGAGKQDLSSGLVRLLAQSGSRVVMSWSEDGPQGVSPNHPAISPVAPAAVGMEFPRGDWLVNRDEPGLQLAVGKSFKAFPLQCVNARAFIPARSDTVCLSKSYADKPAALDADVARVLAFSREDGEGRLQLSDTLMENYLSCSFRWLFSSCLHVEERDTGLSFVDARMLGSVYHDVLKTMFAPFAGTNKLVRNAAGIDMVPAIGELEPALQTVLEQWTRREGPFAGALLRSAKPYLLYALGETLRNVTTILNGASVAFVEQPMRTQAPAVPEAVLVGKADLVAISSDDGAIIIDYKKKTIPEIKELVPDKNGVVARLQIPAYACLVESMDLRARDGWYVAIEPDGKNKWNVLHAFGNDSKAIDAATVPLVMAALQTACAQSAAGIRAGLVFVPHRSDQAQECKDCATRSICRVRYMVE